MNFDLVAWSSEAVAERIGSSWQLADYQTGVGTVETLQPQQQQPEVYRPVTSTAHSSYYCCLCAVK